MRLRAAASEFGDPGIRRKAEFERRLVGAEDDALLVVPDGHQGGAFFEVFMQALHDAAARNLR